MRRLNSGRKILVAGLGVALAALLVACGAGGAQVTAPATADAAPAARAGGSPAASPPRITGNLTVFAASSLTDAFNEMKREIEAANPGTTVTFNFAASSTLETQLEQGARADVFASADEAQMAKAQQAGVIAGDSRLFVRNTPVVIVPANNPAGIARPQDLAKPGVKLVLAAKGVPIGDYARQVFANMDRNPAYGPDFSQRALANLVSNETNVRQVVAKIQLGEGDAGVVYASDVTPSVRGQVKIIPIPEDVNVVARYPAAVVKGAANAAGARAFLDYLVSPAGQAILTKWGFVPLRPGGTPTPTSMTGVPAAARTGGEGR
ncbi:MAG TPA: molybdate ABC transporter substrate-binding protein [Thermomicrobiales bacterium]|nr:molybdate ABC transporter substrate-binding protein [Thermomicrobiales bacterium]